MKKPITLKPHESIYTGIEKCDETSLDIIKLNLLQKDGNSKDINCNSKNANNHTKLLYNDETIVFLMSPDLSCPCIFIQSLGIHIKIKFHRNIRNMYIYEKSNLNKEMRIYE